MMLTRLVTRLVDFSVRFPVFVIVMAVLLGLGSATYVARHFAIHTNVDDLIASDLPWRRHAEDYNRAFPARGFVLVIEAPTPELADTAAGALAGALRQHHGRFTAVEEPGHGSFFVQNGLLYLSTEEVARLTHGLAQSSNLVRALAADPSLRGILDALSLALAGVAHGQMKLDDLARPMDHAADTLADVLTDRPASFSWQRLAMPQPPRQEDLLRFIAVEPVLDYSALEPGRAAAALVTQIAEDLKLKQRYQADVHVTGPAAINDAQFATIQRHVLQNALVALAAVTLILWLALHSFRIMAAVFASVAVGLALSTAAGLLLVGTLNVISVAYFALFIGLSIDFAIQFSVRYRAERSKYPDLDDALRSAAMRAGRPLALAAAATAVGFLSFLPTAYRGLSELGQIAGAGMIIAFFVSITLLPALLAVLKPPGEPEPVGFRFLAPLDHFLIRYRVPIIIGTLVVVLGAAPLLRNLPFDFDPLHLNSARTDAVATFLRLEKQPEIGANAAEVVAPDLDAADALAKRLSALPQVSQVRTLSDFVPQDQDQKIELIEAAGRSIDASLNPAKEKPPPDDRETVAALRATADRLANLAGSGAGAGPAAARRLSNLLSDLAKADGAARQRAAIAFVQPLRVALDALKNELKPQHISARTLPAAVAGQWRSSDGRARVEALPKGDPNDTETLRSFVHAVLQVAPDASGPAVFIYQSARTVLRAFVEAGIFALVTIAALLLLVLRRVSDVLLTLVPLIVAGLVTLELCALFGLSLNFANIIALPLLLGVGVAFKIYYVEAWRGGQVDLLQTSLTRAIFFSALTTATAFGSLWMSRNPGMSSMGKLMAMALVCTLAAAVLFQPALMGPPRKRVRNSDAADRRSEPARQHVPGE